MRILVVMMAPLGDTLFATPAVRALHCYYPEAEIEALVSETGREVLRGNNSLTRLFTVDNTSHLLGWFTDFYRNQYQLALGLSHRGSFLLPLVNAGVKLGFKARELGWFYDLQPPDNRELHAVDYCLEIVKTLGVKLPACSRMELPLTGEDRLKAGKLLAEGENDREGPLVAVHPGGKYFRLKRWPATCFKKLIKKLDHEFGARVVVVGGPGEEMLGQEVIDNSYNYHQQPLNLSGSLKFRETAALLERADLFIGNDSAPQHMAAALGTPVVALFGPTDPQNFHPYGVEYRVVQGDLPCSPCFKWLGDLKQYLPEYLPEWARGCQGGCMRRIRVKQALAAAGELLPARRLTKEGLM